jgi:hypothetical protein
MAQRIVTTLVDDIDGSETEDVATRKFYHGGVELQLDLSEANWEALKGILKQAHDMLLPYVQASRASAGKGHTTPTGRVRGSGSGKAGQNPKRNREIRVWANANGFTIGDRGRIPTEIVEAYDAAQAANRQKSAEGIVKSLVERYGPDPLGNKVTEKPQKAAQAPAQSAGEQKGTWKKLGKPEGSTGRVMTKEGEKVGTLHEKDGRIVVRVGQEETDVAGLTRAFSVTFEE